MDKDEEKKVGGKEAESPQMGWPLADLSLWGQAQLEPFQGTHTPSWPTVVHGAETEWAHPLA